MADDAPSGERSLPATERRRQDARDKGNRVNSRDFSTGLAAVALAAWAFLFGEAFLASSRSLMVAGLVLDAGATAASPAARTATLVLPLALPLAALGALVAVAALVAQALGGGIGFAGSALAPKAERLDPLKGLARMFGPKGLIELCKGLAKVVFLFGGGLLFLWGEAPRIAALAAASPGEAFASLGRITLLLLMLAAAMLLLIGFADLPLQLTQWLRQLRMNRQELIDEQKQQEGSPEVKAAQRRAQQALMKRANRRAVREATVVLTNPTHFAVALRYRPETDAAPVIVGRGRGLLAEVLRELAAEERILVLSYPGVARALYYTGREGQPIRPELYAAVAVIIAHVLRVLNGSDTHGTPPRVDLPDNLQFDEDGRLSADG